jgi:flagellin
MRINNVNRSFFNREQNKLQNALLKLSSAQRINSSADDAAGLAISEKLSSRIRGFKTAGRNVQDSMSALNVADGAGDRVTEILHRQRELSLQATNGTLSDDDRAMLDTEYQQLNEQIEDIARNTEFNQQNVADGTGLGDGNQNTTTGPDGGDTVEMPQVDFTRDNLGITDTGIGTLEDARNSLGAIDSALENVSDQRSGIGAAINRFSSTVANLETAQVNAAAAESAIRDQDMARGIAELTRNQLLNESGRRAFSMFSQISSDHVMNLLQ